ncbi:MAG: DUF4926 domain-containing protein [Cyanobacteria bacterium DS2.3.42]|nr:DUF4926 domain-containing protein [Cyanobacteria bacterium DS2.3.42]
MMKQYQDVELVKDMMSDESLGEPVLLRKGQKGVIVEIHSSSEVPYPGYDVEFFDDAGDTVAVMIVREEDIRALSKRPSAEEVA